MDMDIYARFGFRTLPFTREFPVGQRLSLPHLDEPLAHLERAVHQRMSAALIAPAGAGKTTVLRALAAQLPEARYRVHYVKTTDLSKRDMCREIAAAIGVAHAGIYPMLVRRLQDHFVTATHQDGLRYVVLLDEAHDLRPDVLGMLRLLTNFEMDSRLVVSFVLSGQSSLRTLLSKEALEDIARRLSHYASLRLLSEDETKAYIAHRVTVAGGRASPFDKGAEQAICELSRGNLRAIDRLALKALELAADAKCDVVGTQHVIAARSLVSP